jgi:hypothetical protein
MTSAYDFNLQHVTRSEETAKQIQELLADKGTVLGTLGTVSIDINGQDDAQGRTAADPEAADEPMAPGTSTHMISTEIYFDSAGHVHAVLIDDHTTPSGTVIEILADVAIN